MECAWHVRREQEDDEEEGEVWSDEDTIKHA